jgi:hypothetical protein
VAAPETGVAIRVFHRAARGEFGPEELGLLVAKKLIDAGAKPLLEAAGEVSR